MVTAFFVHKKAQSATETTILLTTLCLALIVMNVYVMRAKQGQLQGQVKTFGELYSPTHSNYTKIQKVDSGSADGSGYKTKTEKGFSVIEEDGMELNVFSKSENVTPQAVRIVSGQISKTKSGMSSLYSQVTNETIKQKLQTHLSGGVVTDYSLINEGSVLEDFSGTQVVDDKISDYLQ